MLKQLPKTGTRISGVDVEAKRPSGIECWNEADRQLVKLQGQNKRKLIERGRMKQRGKTNSIGKNGAWI